MKTFIFLKPSEVEAMSLRLRKPIPGENLFIVSCPNETGDVGLAKEHESFLLVQVLLPAGEAALSALAKALGQPQEQDLPVIMLA